jgi:exopolyphosphatase/guanosine-5'-triphosphate,3'-diphosphate pyrophosphatase
LLNKGEISVSQSLALGSIRLQETGSAGTETPEQILDDMRRQIRTTVTAAATALPIHKAREVVLVGGDARFAAREVGRSTTSAHLRVIDLADFQELAATLEDRAPEDLAKNYGLSAAESETVVPALLIFRAIIERTQAERVLVSEVTMRDGLLLDLARSSSGNEDEALVMGMVHSAEALVEKYCADPKHADYVATTAVRLFDELRAEHGLKARHRLLLRIAGLVHEVGGYVASRAHHKHSYYLVANSEIFGLTRDETQIVAHVARYHRRGVPRPTHVEYMRLPRESRMVVSKLAALLRVADALDRAHTQQIQDFTCHRTPEELVIAVNGVADCTLERRAVRSKGDLFEAIFGMKARVEEAGGQGSQRRRARPFR